METDLPVPLSALTHADTAQLVVIDVQQRLAGAMGSEDRARVLRNAAILLQTAGTLQVPVIATQQYPKGLGPTEPDVADHLPAQAVRLDKTVFSCCRADGFNAAVSATGRSQVVLAGMETHVCVLQTALELHAQGHQVFVVEDACCSRDPANASNAARRLRHAGVIVTNTESVVFEWLGDARHEAFKALSALVR
ncbi:MAG TPA: hydrolase [Gammaproteobacteria bacterium]|nr:hydrolase [Gammaproteobacteria bacterium]